MDKRRLVMDVLSNLVIFTLFYNIFAAFYSMQHDRLPWLYLLFVLPSFALLALRRLVKNIALFIGAHIVLPVLPLLIIEGITTAVIVAVFALVMALYSVYATIKGERRLSVAAGAGVAIFIVAGNFVARTMAERYRVHIDGLDSLTILSVLLVMVTSVAFMQMDNLNANLRVFGKSGATERGVYAVNNKLTGGFAMVVAAFASLAVMLAIGPLLGRLANGFLRFVAWLSALILPDEIETNGEGTDFMGEYVFQEVVAQEGYEVPVDALTRWPYYIAAAVLIALSVFMIVTMLMKVGKALSERLKRRRGEGGEIETAADEIDKLKFAARDLAAFLPRFKFSVAHPVRKAYKKKVTGHIKQGVAVKHCHTPEVIADLIREREDIDRLTEEYEGVRYGRSK